MSRWGIRSAVLPAAALLALACALSSCGGSGSGTSSSSTHASSETESRSGGESEAGTGGKKQSESSKQGGGGDEKAAKTAAPVAPLKVSGGGSAQYRVKGGDNSVQEFGAESSGSELEEAATALHDFLVARARGEWQQACANLSKTVVEQLEQLAARAQQSGTDCPATLAGLTPNLPPKVARESTIVDAGSLRVEGTRGFLIYRGLEGTVYATNMAREGGSWKVGALSGVPLS
ncbi:MAG: hypothetical protein ACM3N0_00750 [Chloroflexota bacterium]